MNNSSISRVLLTALRPRRPIWILFLIAAVTPIGISFIFDPKAQNNLPNLLMTLGGWLLTFAGILFAGNQASRIALADAFSRLYEEESSTDQYNAKKLVAGFGRSILKTPNRYRAARDLIKTLSIRDQRLLHEARRSLTSFWLLAEAYYESHLMTLSEVFSIAGSPEILLFLEPLEVLAAETMGIPMTTGPWPTLRLLREWYRLQKKTIDASKITLVFPIDRQLYEDSISHTSNKPPKQSSLRKAI